jgi:hypothetical protein
MRSLSGRKVPPSEHFRTLAVQAGHSGNPCAFSEQRPPPISHEEHFLLPHMGSVITVVVEQSYISGCMQRHEGLKRPHGRSQASTTIRDIDDTVHMGS